MVNEIERLKAELEVFERYHGECTMDQAARLHRKEIARLEAEADPWREAKAAIGRFQDLPNHRSEVVVGEYVSHLTAEVERLTKRVAELEAEKADSGEIESDYYNVNQAAKEAYEAKHQDADPVLDPARVLATAEIALRARKWHETADNIKFIWQGIDLNAKPYRLKGTDE